MTSVESGGHFETEDSEAMSQQILDAIRNPTCATSSGSSFLK